MSWTPDKYESEVCQVYWTPDKYEYAFTIQGCDMSE